MAAVFIFLDILEQVQVELSILITHIPTVMIMMITTSTVQQNKLVFQEQLIVQQMYFVVAVGLVLMQNLKATESPMFGYMVTMLAIQVV